MKSDKVRAEGERASSGGSNRPPAPSYARIGKYEVETEIEAPKHARVRVFRAVDRDIDRPVTLKLLADLSDQRLADQFRREVSCVAKFRVANMAAIYELGEHAGLPFVAMQNSGDDHLELAIRDKRVLTLLQKMLIMDQVAAGAAEGHRGGLSYVGIRPSAIALGGDGSATIQDFGVVRLTGGKQSKSELYTSPEEATAGFACDVLCDVFSFGIICYEFLTGSHPFYAGDSSGAAACDWRRQPAPLRELSPKCPEPLESFVTRALEKRRELRYQNLDDIRDDLRPILQELKRARAAELRESGRQLIDAEKLEQAQGVVREALQLDPDDTKGHQISAHLRSRLQQQAVREKIEDLWRQAEASAGYRRFFTAVEILESASRLDPADAEARARLDAMRARLAQSIDAADLVDKARLLMDQHDFEAARATVLKALERDPEDPHAPQLLDSIGQALAAREKEARIEEGIAKAKSMALLRSFDQALALLAELRAENPDAPLIPQCIDRIETQKKEAERQSRLQALTSQAQALLSQGRFAELAASIESAGSEFQSDVVLADLLARAREALERARVADDAIARCLQLRQAQRFDQALEVLDRALAVCPAEPALVALRREVDAQMQSSKREAAVRDALTEAQWLEDQDRPDLAVRFLKQHCASIATEPSLVSRLTALEKILPYWEQRRLIRCIQDFSSRRSPDREQPGDGAALLPLLEQALVGCTPPAELAGIAGPLRRRLQAQATVAEVRHYLAAENVDQAEQVLRKGRDALNGELSLVSAQREVEACRKYLSERRTAQALVGRRQLGEAEQVLLRLAAPDRPEVQSLLEVVRMLQAGSDEKAFYSRVREKALALRGQGRSDQADDLFRGLRALFPGDPVLEKDRAAPNPDVRPGREPLPIRIEDAPAPPPKPRPVEQRFELVTPPAGHFPALKMTVITGIVLLTAAGATVWRSSRGSTATAAPASPIEIKSPRAADGTPQSAAEAAPAASDPRAGASRRLPVSARTTRNAAPSRHAPEADTAPLRAFNAPTPRTSGADRAALALPTPPGAAPASPVQEMSGILPIAQGTPTVPPPAPSVAVPKTAPETPAVRVRRAEAQPPKLISAPAPVFPIIASRAHVSGTVDIEAMVDRQGRVSTATVVRGNPLLTEAARRAVLAWRYEPASVDGEPAEAKVLVKVNFQDVRK